MILIKKVLQFLSFSILLFGCSTVPLKKAAQHPEKGNMLLSVQENYPSQKHWYSFSLSEYCPSSSPLRIKKFESHKMYSSVDTGELKPVRIVHIYASIYEGHMCKKIKSKQLIERVDIPIDERMTHVYVTYDSLIQVSSGH